MMSEWTYPRAAESGYFRSPRPVVDPGAFTKISADIPLAALRRKPLALGIKSRKYWKRARLTPIHEHEEMNKGISFDSEGRGACMDDVTQSRDIRMIQDSDVEMRYTRKPDIDRSDTPVTVRKAGRVLRKMDDKVEYELANILEGDSNVHLSDPEVRRRLAELPPRPSCKRKVLPPSVTSNKDISQKNNKVKVLRVRQKLEQSLDPLHKTVVKHRVIKDETVPEYLKNSKSTASRNIQRKEQDSNLSTGSENGVCVLTLNDLKGFNGLNDTGILPSPDISSCVSKIAKADEDRSSGSSTLEENGSLSTPRYGQSTNTILEEQEDKCLKGTDLSSFYNMWDRDYSRRPFGKKVPGKLPLYRSCLCALKNPANRNCRVHHLPPL